MWCIAVRDDVHYGMSDEAGMAMEPEYENQGSICYWAADQTVKHVYSASVEAIEAASEMPMMNTWADQWTCFEDASFKGGELCAFAPPDMTIMDLPAVMSGDQLKGFYTSRGSSLLNNGWDRMGDWMTVYVWGSALQGLAAGAAIVTIALSF